MHYRQLKLCHKIQRGHVMDESEKVTVVLWSAESGVSMHFSDATPP
jgi:hypothetical protein